MPVYHIQLNMTDLRSPAAAAFEVDGGVVRWAQATCTPVNTIASRTVNCSGGLFLRLRAIALALRVLRLRAIALALRVLRLRAIALALRVALAFLTAAAYRPCASRAAAHEYLMMRTKEAGSKLAPPTSAPSISSFFIRAEILSGFTLPPYKMPSAYAAAGL